MEGSFGVPVLASSQQSCTFNPLAFLQYVRNLGGVPILVNSAPPLCQPVSAQRTEEMPSEEVAPAVSAAPPACYHRVGRESNNPSNLHVSYLPLSINSEEEFKGLISSFAPKLCSCWQAEDIVSVKLIRHLPGKQKQSQKSDQPENGSKLGKSKGYGFVLFSSSRAAACALADLHQQLVRPSSGGIERNGEAKRLVVSFASDPNEAKLDKKTKKKVEHKSNSLYIRGFPPDWSIPSLAIFIFQQSAIKVSDIKMLHSLKDQNKEGIAIVKCESVSDAAIVLVKCAGSNALASAGQKFFTSLVVRYANPQRPKSSKKSAEVLVQPATQAFAKQNNGTARCDCDSAALPAGNCCIPTSATTQTEENRRCASPQQPQAMTREQSATQVLQCQNEVCSSSPSLRPIPSNPLPQEALAPKRRGLFSRLLRTADPHPSLQADTPAPPPPEPSSPQVVNSPVQRKQRVVVSLEARESAHPVFNRLLRSYVHDPYRGQQQQQQHGSIRFPSSTPHPLAASAITPMDTSETCNCSYCRGCSVIVSNLASTQQSSEVQAYNILGVFGEIIGVEYLGAGKTIVTFAECSSACDAVQSLKTTVFNVVPYKSSKQFT